MIRFSIVVFALGIAAQAAPAQVADSIPARDAYLDAAAADHVRLARARRQIADLSVERYRALSKERMSVGLRGIRRDRLLYRREVAGRLEWTRTGTARIEVLGAREAVPVAIKGVQLPSDLAAFMPHLAFDPADHRLLVDWNDDEFVRHPLAPDAERFYRYRTGGTTSIQLPDGRIVRLIELEIVPRTRDSRNITGSFWLEAETHSIVQAAFRLARDIDFERDLADEDDDDIPGFMKPITISVEHVTIEYGLYDLKWWMPRTMLFEGAVRMGMLRMPMQYERTYSEYEIEARGQPVTAPLAELRAQDSLRRAHADSGRWQVVMPADTAAMLTSATLPPDIFATGEQLISERELEELRARIEQAGGGAGPALLPEPVVHLDALSVRRTRYNRVEGLSPAAHGEVDFGAYRAAATVRIGLADREPNFDMAATHVGRKRTLTAAAYRRLNGFDPFVSPFTVGSSASALVLGRDEADYYRALGVELRAAPSGSAGSWYALRLFAQRESAAQQETNFSLRSLLNDSFEFRENLRADEGDWYGAEVTLRRTRGLDPEGWRFGAELYGHGAFGTSDFARGALTLRMGVPLPGAFTGALEAAAGITSTESPLQYNWYVGGLASLRGYHTAALSGETFWRGRAEIGYGLPALRIVGFGDAGWAGARDGFATGRPLLSVGGGVSFLDGIVRFDVARGLRAPGGWSTTLYFDAAL
ncbi:MAG: hypothetical protein ACT443_11760 [Gemmatimonadota bacterium]